MLHMFRLSNIIVVVLQIEKGWNNIFVSIISIETGETIAKSGKASVENGKCHWEDSMLSTMWISPDLLQHNESFLLKLVVAMVCWLHSLLDYICQHASHLILFI